MTRMDNPTGLTASQYDRPQPGSPRAAELPPIASNARTLRELLDLPPLRLVDVDIARMNLLCASGLLGAEDVGVDHYLGILESWAARCGAVTRQSYRLFVRNPGDYDNSEPYFRMLVLTTALQKEYHLKYNLERIDREDWSDSRDLFIHGLLGERRSGTCPSMPTLITAIGRRLGYPLRLVLARRGRPDEHRVPRQRHAGLPGRALSSLARALGAAAARAGGCPWRAAHLPALAGAGGGTGGAPGPPRALPGGGGQTGGGCAGV